MNLIEQFYTRSELYKQLLLISIGLCAIAAVFILPDEFSANAGMIYFLIGPVLFIYYRFRRKRLYKMFSDEDLIAHDRWLVE